MSVVEVVRGQEKRKAEEDVEEDLRKEVDYLSWITSGLPVDYRSWITRCTVTVRCC